MTQLSPLQIKEADAPIKAHHRAIAPAVPAKALIFEANQKEGNQQPPQKRRLRTSLVAETLVLLVANFVNESIESTPSDLNALQRVNY